MGKDDARAQRLAEALRENLKRRKAQQRDSAVTPAAASGGEDERDGGRDDAG